MPHPPRKKMRRSYGNRSLTQCPETAACSLSRRLSPCERAGHFCPPRTHKAIRQVLRVEDSHDLECPRIDHEDLVVHEDELIPAPFRIDRYDFPRKRVESHVARHAGADRD